MSADTAAARNCFFVTGDTFTEIVRNLLLDQRPDRAYRLIVDGLGAGAESIVAPLLRGEMRLSGDSSVGMEVEDDPDSADYKRRLRYLYAGRFNHGGRWYRPVAYVSDVGPDDAHFANKSHRQAMPGSADAYRWGMQRVRYYAGADGIVLELRSDVVIGDHRIGEVICEPVGEPAAWMQYNADVDAALADYLAAGRWLEDRSWSKVHGQHFKAAGTVYDRAGVEPQTTDPTVDTESLANQEIARKNEAERLQQLAANRAEILRRAGADTIDLTRDDGTVVATVPRAPFEAWAMRGPLGHLAPSWKCVSMPGAKKWQNDSAEHTDWVTAIGLDPATYDYDGEIHHAAISALTEVQQRLASFECGVLSYGPEEALCGEVGDDVIVVPDLSPKHAQAVLSAKAVITERGGELAHCAIIAREAGIPVVVVPDARKRFPKGVRVMVDARSGKVTVFG